MLSFQCLYNMAKSKSGGTRSYLRGRIASDVYSIGRDSNGRKQQVVRSLAESVKNPQTLAQMKGRAIMSTVMQAVSGLSFIIDHSFDGVPNGQPSISEFIRRNYSLVKADVNAHPASGNSFGINKYQEKGIMPGAYQVSYGTAFPPTWIGQYNFEDMAFRTSIPVSGKTAAEVRAEIGLGTEDYLTFVLLDYFGKANVIRLHPSNALSADTAITKENFMQLFSVEQIGDINIVISDKEIAGTTRILITFLADDGASVNAAGRIVTLKKEDGFEHSSETLVTNVSEYSDTFSRFDTAIATYPIGEERFLNGGEL